MIFAVVIVERQEEMQEEVADYSESWIVLIILMSEDA